MRQRKRLINNAVLSRHWGNYENSKMYRLAQLWNVAGTYERFYSEFRECCTQVSNDGKFFFFETRALTRSGALLKFREDEENIEFLVFGSVEMSLES